MRRAILISAMLSASPAAHALPEPPPNDAPIPPTDEPVPDDVPAPRPGEPAPPSDGTPSEPASPPETPRLSLLRDELAKLRDELEDRETKLKIIEQRVNQTQDTQRWMSWLPRFITAFIDVGAFAVGGNGAGIRSDYLHIHYPQYRNRVFGQWVFMGDPYSTAINALGEPADTANSREAAVDTINSSGRPSLIVNSIGLSLSRSLTDGFALAALVEFLPRPGSDLIDVELAHINYKPLAESELVISVGKIDSVLGIEYRAQDAIKRTTVTPSLICRYTCGRPLGIRAQLDHSDWSVSGSITNGDDFTERFEPKDQLKANAVPSAAAHVQWRFPIGQGLWLGTSGMVGPQDGQSRLGVHQWHYGVDAKLIDLDGWEGIAEFVQGHEQGSTSGDPAQDAMLGIERPRCDLVVCLTYKGAYVLIDRRVTESLQPYIRFDWRDAVHEKGVEFVYQSHTVRATVGIHFALSSEAPEKPGRIVGKLEYTWNRELGVPQFPHDIITSSIVVQTD